MGRGIGPHPNKLEHAMQITDLEATVINAFDTYESLAGTISDLGVSWTDAATLAKDTSLDLKTVKGVLGSLVKKGLVFADNDNGQPNSAVCLTENGAETVFNLRDTVPADVLADDPSIEQDDEGQEALIAENEEASLTAALIKAGADEQAAKNMGIPAPGIICATLRLFASTWTGTRKSFISTASLAGFNKVTAATQWQRAKDTSKLEAILEAISK